MKRVGTLIIGFLVSLSVLADTGDNSKIHVSSTQGGLLEASISNAIVGIELNDQTREVILDIPAKAINSYTLEVYDMFGMVITVKEDINTNKIILNELVTGAYYFSLIGDGNNFIGQFIIR